MSIPAAVSRARRQQAPRLVPSPCERSRPGFGDVEQDLVGEVSGLRERARPLDRAKRLGGVAELAERQSPEAEVVRREQRPEAQGLLGRLTAPARERFGVATRGTGRSLRKKFAAVAACNVDPVCSRSAISSSRVERTSVEFDGSRVVVEPGAPRTQRGRLHRARIDCARPRARRARHDSRRGGRFA